jgi:Tol biopolymer transport system component
LQNQLQEITLHFSNSITFCSLPIVETIPRRGFRISIPIIEKVFVEESTEVLETPQIVQKSFFNHYKTAILVLTLIIVSALLTGFTVNYFFSSKSSGATVENVTFQKLTFSGDVSFPIISPDGKSFAYVRENGIYLQDVNTGNNFKLNIPDHKVFGNLQFSVDNETIYFRNENSFDAGGTLFQVSRFGGAAKKIAENVWSSPGFSPDGKHAAFMRFAPSQSRWILIVRNLETSEEKELIWRDSPFTLYRTGFPVWSFDGKKIATVEQTPNQKKISNLIVVNVETGATETLETPRLVQIEQVAWQPKDKGLVLVGREDGRFFQLWKISYPDSDLQKITNDLSIYRTISLSTDGTKLLARQQILFSHLWTAKADQPENQKQITFGNLSRDGINEGTIWTKDNQTIIYSSRITGNVDLWSINAANGEKEQLTENAGSLNESPVFSLDEKHIYFSSTRTGTRHIWRIDHNGENPVQMTFGEKEIEFYPAISPDGNWLYFIRKSTNQNTIWRKSLIDGKLEQVTETGKFSPNSFLSFSPDGQWLAFNNFIEKKQENINNKRIQIAAISVNNSSPPKFFNIIATVSKIVWTTEGKTFDYIENTPAETQIWRQNFDGSGEPTLIVSLPNTQLNDFAISPDGANAVFSRGKNENDTVLLQNFE